MNKSYKSLLLIASLLLPSLAFAAGGEHGAGHHAAPEHVPTAVWFHLINLSILAFLLYRVLRKPTRDFLVKRQDTIREALERSETARIEAERQNAVYRQRLEGLSTEIATLRSQTEASARAEADQLVHRAQASAARIEQDIQRMLNDELNRARYQLRQEAIEMAVKLAEGILAGRVTDADQRRLAEEYLQRVGHLPTEIH